MFATLQWIYLQFSILFKIIIYLLLRFAHFHVLNEFGYLHCAYILHHLYIVCLRVATSVHILAESRLLHSALVTLTSAYGH